MRWPIAALLASLLATIASAYLPTRAGDVSTVASPYGMETPVVAQPVPLGPTTTVVTTTTLATTTTLSATAPNWTTNMVAVWNLDEGTGNRADATGNGHTLDAVLATMPGNDTGQKMQGVASMLQQGTGGMRRGPDNALAAPTPPFSWGCWVRPTDTSSGGEDQTFIGSYDFNIGGFYLSWVDAANGYRSRACKGFGVCQTAGIASTGVDNTFSHVVGNILTDRLQLVVNGTQRDADQIATGFFTPDTGDWFYVGQGEQDTRKFLGQVDECFLFQGTLAITSSCRICSCGIDGSLCVCSGTTYTSNGRNAASCGTCTLPACNKATP